MPTAFQDETEYTQKVGEVACSFTTGPAGSGKTYSFRQRIEADETEGILCATTGVAAVNLGTTTLNSTLGYFDTDDLADKYAEPNSRLVRRLIHLRKVEGYRSLMIDEASMLDAYALGIITQAVMDANNRMDGPRLGIELTGDFAQLPPVKGEWAFKSSYWDKHYAENVTRLEKVYRQADLEFLHALNLARKGDGVGASEALRPLAKFTSGLDLEFSGTTIVAKNMDVDKINTLRYMKLAGTEAKFRNQRWGQQRGEWKNIPDFLQLKIGALVMILNNGYSDPETGARELIFANGDTGKVVEIQENGVWVALNRNDLTHFVPFVERRFETKDEPDASKHPNRYFDEKRKRWVSGSVTYLPVRLSYAVTVHKSQGLTLDRVQLDTRAHFFGSPNMAYVALSRVRSPQGLKIVGTPEMLSKRINADKEIGAWL